MKSYQVKPLEYFEYSSGGGSLETGFKFYVNMSLKEPDQDGLVTVYHFDMVTWRWNQKDSSGQDYFCSFSHVFTRDQAEHAR